ncbi:MAG: GNAT family acetyltransferase [Bifidobacterium sp.]|uniref:GNAT family acetyltransferase n=1 Tax=Bifidobacterium fermentum TaxID=3059035 RepID=A0AB39UNG9_9BIFI
MVQTSVLIRPATSTDADDIILLWKECGLTRPWNDPDADLHRLLDFTQAHVLVAQEQEGRLDIAGSVVAQWDGHRGWISFLCVSDRHRHDGIGTLLIEQAERWLVNKGAPAIQLLIRNDNETVTGFYRKLGYGQVPSALWQKRYDGHTRQ